MSDREQMLAKSTALQTAAEQSRAKVEESLELYKANSAALQASHSNAWISGNL